MSTIVSQSKFRTRRFDFRFGPRAFIGRTNLFTGTVRLYLSSSDESVAPRTAVFARPLGSSHRFCSESPGGSRTSSYSPVQQIGVPLVRLSLPSCRTHRIRCENQAGRTQSVTRRITDPQGRAFSIDINRIILNYSFRNKTSKRLLVKETDRTDQNERLNIFFVWLYLFLCPHTILLSVNGNPNDTSLRVNICDATLCARPASGARQGFQRLPPPVHKGRIPR